MPLPEKAIFESALSGIQLSPDRPAEGTPAIQLPLLAAADEMDQVSQDKLWLLYRGDTEISFERLEYQSAVAGSLHRDHPVRRAQTRVRCQPHGTISFPSLYSTFLGLRRKVGKNTRILLWYRKGQITSLACGETKRDKSFDEPNSGGDTIDNRHPDLTR